MENIIRRGQTLYVRFSIPTDRWGDVGQAMCAAGGIKREIVKTLETTDMREAGLRRGPALAAIRAKVDAALVAAKMRPLTDWTASWADRAAGWREQMQAGTCEVVHTEPEFDGSGRMIGTSETTASDMLTDAIEEDADKVLAVHGLAAAAQFLAIATSKDQSIAQVQRLWLHTQAGKVRAGTINSHETAFKKLDAYLKGREEGQSLDTMALSQMTRRMAGEFLEARREQSAAGTVLREFSAYSGLWRWALNKGHVDVNPWGDLACPRLVIRVKC